MLQRIRVLGESTFRVPSKAKSQQLFNQLPIDLARLLIKRKGKDSTDFIIHYHNLEEMNDVSSPQIVNLYRELKSKEAQIPLVKKTSLPLGMGGSTTFSERRTSIQFTRRGTQQMDNIQAQLQLMQDLDGIDQITEDEDLSYDLEEDDSKSSVSDSQNNGEVQSQPHISRYQTQGKITTVVNHSKRDSIESELEPLNFERAIIQVHGLQKVDSNYDLHEQDSQDEKKEKLYIGGPTSRSKQTEEEITPLAKGRYAKAKVHWNKIANASPRAKHNDYGEQWDDERAQKSCLITDDSLLDQELSHEKSELISDYSSEMIS